MHELARFELELNVITRDALEMLYKAQKATRVAIANAETRHAKQDELDNLHKKLVVIGYLIALVTKEL